MTKMMKIPKMYQEPKYLMASRIVGCTLSAGLLIFTALFMFSEAFGAKQITEQKTLIQTELTQPEIPRHQLFCGYFEI